MTTLSIENLIQQLKGENAQDRVAAVNMLADLEATAARDEIIVCLKDDDTGVRLAAIRTINKIGGERRISALTDCLDDPDDNVRYQAAMYLCPTNDPRAIAKMKERLAIETGHNLGMIINTLGCTGDESLVDDLAPFLRHSDLKIRFRAIRAMGDLQSPQGISHLIPCLDYSDVYSGYRLYNVAADQLRKIDTAEALQAIQKWKSQTRFRRLTHRVSDILKFIFVGDGTSDGYASRLVIFAIIVIIIVVLSMGMSLTTIIVSLIVIPIAMVIGFYVMDRLMELLF